MSLRSPFLILLSGVALTAPGCDGVGACHFDEDREAIWYDADGFPAHSGQAMLDSSCGAGAFCHSSGIQPFARHGVPEGLEFDITVRRPGEGIERLRHAHEVVTRMRSAIYSQVLHGHMPPTGRGGDDALAAGRARRYVRSPGTPEERLLPSLHTEEGHELLRNWLACGVHVIEATEGESTGVGDIVPPLSPCDPGLTECEEGCVDTTGDPLHCGACGVACVAPRSECVSGGCGCPSPSSACGELCVNHDNDGEHCGGCDIACGARVCSMGSCVDTCAPGEMDCAGSCVDLAVSTTHCGACGTTCRSDEICASGACACPAGIDCAGACIDDTTDPMNCGGCGVVCGVRRDCVASSCVCGAGRTECGGTCVDTSTDPANCGACGATCGADPCVGSACVTCGPAVSFAADVQPIFTSTCLGSGCHSGPGPAASLSLEAGRAHAELVGVPASCGTLPLVRAGSEADSYLLRKLTGVAICSGERMPREMTLGVPPLDAARMDVIRAWICRGALP